MPEPVSAPLFPLPNVVLFPGAILPLHIFEPRYRRMTADVLEGGKRIAMALLRPGWEKLYYGKPTIEQVVCVGRIVAHERLADGKYNFLLQGQWRAVIARESVAGGETPYRVARTTPLPQTEAMEIDLAPQRRRLMELFADGMLAQSGLGHQFARLLAGPMPMAQIVDLAAFNYLEDVPLKQSLLADGDVCGRAERVVAALEELRQRQQTEATRETCGDAKLN